MRKKIAEAIHAGSIKKCAKFPDGDGVCKAFYLQNKAMRTKKKKKASNEDATVQYAPEYVYIPAYIMYVHTI